MLEIQDLHVGYYRDLNILQGVSLHARKGQITAVLGPNGVGKSTLLKTVFGFIKPQRGVISFAGQDIAGTPSHNLVQLGISYIPQRQSVFPQMTVEENLELGAWSFRSDKARIQERIEANYKRFPVLRDRRRSPAGELSGGTQRMVEIGRILMADPKLILVDEPTAGLAIRLEKEIYDLLVQLKEEGVTLLLVDQNIRQAINIADYVYVLELGRNRLDGPRNQFEDFKKALWL
ncbi:MAG: ABC transporter ATP-binding protein [Chloroflexi bacterium GWB2_49_20]|nr:MAG: ABC transporter ATP-binding protein [Chloroflexi bacterium GWB2_49_20]OGN77330.1 MAG: ABC transporter ATP-binding protein [Chloroflexi bacterium GWC2_49_37]OGN84660.1 MAG: ABC transporter ATP-binding protein [Chloroflexi bacterium GWD2_49_16]HBG74831.1 ABC transporter ATP-binding protein [Anaerolineae bacterium]HCC77994.1 ABC transporter ATP-binding protein [Anaerolineae bacterium]